MKKVSIFALMISVAAVMTGCSKDFKNQLANPQSPVVSANVAEAATETDTVTDTTIMLTGAELNTEVTTSDNDITEDYTELAGYWYLDGVNNEDFIFHITKEGKFTSYVGCGLENKSGYVRREIDSDTAENIYCMYLDSGELYKSFSDDGENEKSDIVMRGDDVFRYVKRYGEDGLGFDPGEQGKAFAGSWEYGRAYIGILEIGNGLYQSTIKWGGSLNTYESWVYTLEYDNGKLVCRGNGTKITSDVKEINEGEFRPFDTVAYTDGSAEFTLEGDKLVWNDLKEHCADNILFDNTRHEQ